MLDPRLEDHAIGLEQQIVELVEQQHRAEVQGREAAATQFQRQIENLYDELAFTAERLTTPG